MPNNMSNNKLKPTFAHRLAQIGESENIPPIPNTHNNTNNTNNPIIRKRRSTIRKSISKINPNNPNNTSNTSKPTTPSNKVTDTYGVFSPNLRNNIYKNNAFVNNERTSAFTSEL